MDSKAFLSTRDPQLVSDLSQGLYPKIRGAQPYTTLFSSLERLWDCRAKLCTERRDDIFSLLSVSSNGHEMAMDYSISREELAIRFLHMDEESFCLCHVAMVFEHIEAEILRSIESTWPNYLSDFIEVQSPVTLSYHDRVLL
ncbi:uncharacterized protein CC84DRAFT_834252 [Paraphaeosphaeria sporulosa]|uniref:Uncharacterized protein n=1 Tax=Paraphaeosphaeria sporulosa TaxID=1460663 RepID=A0A177CD96_9PLEO|nr:uncharacterized protein CC84DRAFT_834252 [Paraphaeosphaeria sporulosa]OAG05286.1 hypothetical protein CC84DRAFT_834252 [Paraphaeosphaeria sporulosa]